MNDDKEMSLNLKENGEIVKGIKGVILDMDGLMIDSEPVHVKAFDAVLKRYGFGLTEEENTQRYVGISGLDCSKDMIARYNLSLTPQEMVRLQQEEYKRLLGGQVITQPGLIELLKQLKKSGFKTAIASGATTEEIDFIIKILGIGEYIDSYTSSQEVEHGKPAPDLFLRAAEKINEPPASCLVLEDAPSGVVAAEAAGMPRFAIPSRETKDKDFSNATKKLDSLSEVFQFISK